MSLTNQIVEDLAAMIHSAKKRKTEQGLTTFQGYLDRLKASASDSEEKVVIEKMKHELAGFQRFADLISEEWTILNRLIS